MSEPLLSRIIEEIKEKEKEVQSPLLIKNKNLLDEILKSHNLYSCCEVVEVLGERAYCDILRVGWGMSPHLSDASSNE